MFDFLKKCKQPPTAEVLSAQASAAVEDMAERVRLFAAPPRILRFAPDRRFRVVQPGEAAGLSNSVSSSTHPALLEKLRPQEGALIFLVAERVRFELTRAVRPCRFSRPVHSTALPPLRRVAARFYPKIWVCPAAKPLNGGQLALYRPEAAKSAPRGGAKIAAEAYGGHDGHFPW